MIAKYNLQEDIIKPLLNEISSENLIAKLFIDHYWETFHG